MPGIAKNVYLNIDSEADATVALGGVGSCQLWVVKNFWAMLEYDSTWLCSISGGMVGAFLGTPESRPNSIASIFAGAI
jgi:hypothetical protein